MQPWIPKFMIGSGAGSLLVVIFSLFIHGASVNNTNTLALGLFIFTLVVGLFLSAWQIAGNVWVWNHEMS